MRKMSRRAIGMKGSLTRRLFNMAKEYSDVIDLTLGDPDLQCPGEIKNAGCEAIQSGKTKYSMNAGLLEAREAVVRRVKKTWNVDNCETDNIILTAGGMEALFLSLQAIVDDGDEVILFAPYYVNYVEMVNMCGGVPVIINAYGENGFEADRETILKYVTEKTVAVIVNTPNNPTGEVMSREFLKNVLEVATEKDLYIISDEVYRTLVYEDTGHTSILEFDGAEERTILIDSMSKEYCMTGWRIGFAYGTAEIIRAMTKMQENVASCAALPSQYAMIKAYNDDIANDYVVEEFRKRRDFLFDAINKIDLLSCRKPQGTFYLFISIEKTGMGSLEFAEKFLKEKHVAVVPGISYGENYDGYIRIAFTKDVTVLQQGIERLNNFINSIDVRGGIQLNV